MVGNHVSIPIHNMNIDNMQAITSNESGYESAAFNPIPTSTLTHSCVTRSHWLRENTQTVYSNIDVLFTVDEIFFESDVDPVQV